MFVVELVEGKDHTRQDISLDFEDLGRNTVGLLLHMMKIYFSTGGYVILDSSFYVLKGLIQLRKKGIFACYVKKREYNGLLWSQVKIWGIVLGRQKWGIQMPYR